MSWGHIHLVLTHIPVIGIGAIMVVLVTRKMRRNPDIERLSLEMFVVLALLSVAVYLTGSPATHQDARPARDFTGQNSQPLTSG